MRGKGGEKPVPVQSQVVGNRCCIFLVMAVPRSPVYLVRSRSSRRGLASWKERWREAGLL